VAVADNQDHQSGQRHAHHRKTPFSTRANNPSGSPASTMREG
jgi:hypothetical protein